MPKVVLKETPQMRMKTMATARAVSVFNALNSEQAVGKLVYIALIVKKIKLN